MIISTHKRSKPSWVKGLPFSRCNNLVNTEYRAYKYGDFEIYCTVSTHGNPVVTGFLDNYAVSLCGMLKQ